MTSDDSQVPGAEVEQPPPAPAPQGPAAREIPCAEAPHTQAISGSLALTAQAKSKGMIRHLQMPLTQLPSPEQRPVVVVETHQRSADASTLPVNRSAEADLSSPPQSQLAGDAPDPSSPASPGGDIPSWCGSA